MPTPTDSREHRRDAIRRLLLEGPQPHQRGLVEFLKRRGFHATQSSVSRDLRDLGAVKTSRGYELPDATAATDDMAHVAGLVRSLNPAGPNLLVIRTATGAAQRVAVALDRSGWTDIVGTLAGDDTVFVATTAVRTQRRVAVRLERSLDLAS